MHVLFFIFCSTEIGSIIKNTITQSVSRQDHYLYHCAFVDNVFGHEIKIYKASKRQDTPPPPVLAHIMLRELLTQKCAQKKP
jgi:hypothetical protein